MSKSTIFAIAVWIIIGRGWALKCDATGCTSPDIYWTGAEKNYGAHLPKGWSLKLRDAKRYQQGTDINYVIPNGRHCCQIEDPMLIKGEEN